MKKTVTIEFDEVFVIRRLRQVMMKSCAKCGQHVRVVTPDEAAIIAKVGSRTIYRWVEESKVHFIESAEGFLLICLNSLPQ